MKKRAVVVHSGGMDSSICLALALKEFGKENVLSISFQYDQRHSNEITAAKKICKEWGVDQTILEIKCLKEITEDALTCHDLPITMTPQGEPSTLVLGRNGLMARLAAIHAHHLGAGCIYMGVIEVEEANSGYRDCSRKYMDLMEQILRIDLNAFEFEIRTPLVKMTKLETMELAQSLQILPYLLKNTITCYQGLASDGCMVCPACILRNEAIEQFKIKYPNSL
ncbi:MAG: 7-cyano-7-deazaguanine synthase QueC [Waddliaceae bacterium]